MIKYTNIGVQLMPSVLMMSAVAFEALHSSVAAFFCGLLGIFMWCVLFGSDLNYKK